MDVDPTAGKELRKLEKYLRALPSVRRLTSLPTAQRHAIAELQDSLTEAIRLHNDAVKADTSAVMANSLQRCTEQLDIFSEKLLQASTYDLVDTADVAHLSAMSEAVQQLLVAR